MIVSRIDTVKELVESNQLGCSYRFSVKPVAMKGTPRFRYSLLIQDGTTEPPTVYVKKELKTIPQEYINLGPNDKRIVLRQDGYTTLKDIKKFHRKVLKSRGVADEVFQRHCMNLDLSVDGVRETNYGQRTFSIMSARLGATIYILKVHNYLIGNADSKPTLEESFR